jgi:hypothetical protein
MVHPEARNTLIKTLISFGLVLVFLMALVPTITILNNKNSDLKKGEEGFIEAIGPEFDENGPVIIVLAKQTAMDPFNGAKYSLTLTPFGSLANGDKLTQNITIEINSKLVRFHADSRMEKQEVSVGFEVADVDRYPFDRYLFGFTFSASAAGKPIHITGGVVSQLQGWNFVSGFVVEEDNSESFSTVFAVANRTMTTLGFSLFCAVLLWSLALAILVLTLSFIFFPGSESPPVPVYVAMLFALPAVRQTQPGVPPIGAMIDLISFFWCMGLIAICTITVIGITIVKKWKSYSATFEKC